MFIREGQVRLDAHMVLMCDLGELLNRPQQMEVVEETKVS